jgi:flagellar protein FlaG
MRDKILPIGASDFEPSTQSAELVEAIQRVQNKQQTTNEIQPSKAKKEDHSVSDAVINERVDELNRQLVDHNKHVEWSVHDATNRRMFKLLDDETGEVIKEFPAEKLLNMAADTWERFGLMVDKTV